MGKQGGAGRAGDEVRTFDHRYFASRYGALFPGVDLGDPAQAAEAYRRGNRGGQALDPNPYFDETGYRTANPDVVTAIGRGALFSGFHHWLHWGEKEGRSGWRRVLADAEDAPPLRQGDAEELLRSLAALPLEQVVALLRASRVFDGGWYHARHGDVDANLDPVVHYCTVGHLQGRAPHLFFDSGFYLAGDDQLAASGILPLLHFVVAGAGQERQPHPDFELSWYIREHGIDPAHINPLAHYSQNAPRHAVSPNRDFDIRYYVDKYPAAKATPDAYEDFIRYGVFKRHRPSPGFNTAFYYAQHLDDDRRLNAFLHYRRKGRAAQLPTDVPKEAATIPRELRRFTAPGPGFEELDRSIARGAARKAKLIAFYLPQFHAIPENDRWWGRGFTEWTNIARATPRFVGHYQPRTPRDLGHYDLTDLSVMRRQVDLARDMGLYGFCFYFYWFNRHRLLEKPLNAFLEAPDIDFPFMILWANENWTRRWDGMENDVLLRQDYSPEDEDLLLETFHQHFSDRRYIRIGGRPLIGIYRPDLLPDCRQTLARWREKLLRRHGDAPLFYMAQSMGNIDPHENGFDGAMEFPPHKLAARARPTTDAVKLLDLEFDGVVHDYQDFVHESLSEPPPPFPLIKTIVPSWDNSARRQGAASVVHNSTPEAYRDWLSKAIDIAVERPAAGEPIVMINAWNEWAEGAYLEPDVHYGGAYLNATARAVTRGDPALAGERYKVLLVGHDAWPSGAQRLLLNTAKVLRNRFGCELHLLLLGGGELLAAYDEVCDVTVLNRGADLAATLRGLRERGYGRAIVNTTVGGAVVSSLKGVGFSVATLVHELPTTIRFYRCEAAAEQIRRLSDVVVFPSAFVRDAFCAAFGAVEGRVVVQPQGIYQAFAAAPDARAAVRQELGLPPDARIILNVGHADLRKGVDLFAAAARLAAERRPDVHFVWAGSFDPALESWIRNDARHLSRLHFIGPRADVNRLMSAADVFYLSSREDPFPSVVLEALQVGTPVVAHAGGGGYVDLLGADPQLGRLAPAGDTAAALEMALAYADDADGIASSGRETRMATARKFDFPDYCFGLLSLLDPSLKKVSVLVPNYNYADCLPARLNSIFDQTYPIYEIAVFDDASTDASVPVIMETVRKAGRDVAFHFSRKNSGGAFGQWDGMLGVAKGDLVWIAEADDLAEPRFVEDLAARTREAARPLFAFSDSRTIDRAGMPLGRSYKSYYATGGRDLLQDDRDFAGEEFARTCLSVKNFVLNVSSVLWDAAALRSAFATVKAEMAQQKLVGDWLMYLATCQQAGTVSYVARPLNVHRRHADSVTQALDVERHVREIAFAHDAVRRAFGASAELGAVQARYLEEVREHLGRQSGQPPAGRAAARRGGRDGSRAKTLS